MSDIHELRAENERLVAEVERLRETSEHRAELLRDALRERDGKQDALVKLFASWRRVRDLANERLARAEAAEAKVAKVEALRGHGSPVVLGGVWGTWVADSEWDAVLADAPTEQRAEACADCGHLHTPDGCTGPPTPSDVWAGVSPAGCDCDAAEGDGRG